MSLHSNFELTEEVDCNKDAFGKGIKTSKTSSKENIDFVFVATANTSSIIEFILNLKLNIKNRNQGFVKIAWPNYTSNDYNLHVWDQERCFRLLY